MKEKIRQYTQVRESKRAKRVKIQYRKGTFTIVKPESMQIDQNLIIENNLEWFKSKLSQAEKYRKQIPNRDYCEGAKLSVLGEEKKIILEKRRSNSVEDNIFLAKHLVDRTSIKDQLEKALKSHVRAIIHNILEDYVDRIDGDYNKVFIRDQDTRWGSCSSKNNLNFNWRLVLGPYFVLEYVVVHELVHLEINNHGEGFESRVDQLFGDRVKAESWLDDNSAVLEF